MATAAPSANGRVIQVQQWITAERDADATPDGLRRLSALLPKLPDSVEKIAARLKLSNKARKRLALAAEAELDGSPQALAYWIGREAAEDRLLLAGLPEQARSIAGWPVPKLPIGGGELIKRGLQPGPLVASTLKAIERRWVEEGFPEEKRLAQLVDEALPAR